MRHQGCRGVFGSILFGPAFFGCGLLLIVIFGQSYTLRCSRPEPSQVSCTRERRWLRTFETGNERLTGLSRAWVGESCDEDGCTYRVELDTAEGQFGLTGYYSSGYDEKRILASEINTFLADPRIETLEVRSDAGLLGFLLPALFMTIGMGAALFSLLKIGRALLGHSGILSLTDS